MEIMRRKGIILLFVLLGFSGLLIPAGCGGGGGGGSTDPTPTPTPTPTSTTISGVVTAPTYVALGRTAGRAAAATGLVAKAGVTVELYRVDDTGAKTGATLASTTTNGNGEYGITLPTGVTISSSLVVAVGSGDNLMRAMVVSTTSVHINPLSELIFSKIAANAQALASFTVNEVISIRTQVETDAAAINLSAATTVSAAVTTLYAGTIKTNLDNNITIASGITSGTVCGNGIVEIGETCDDGNATVGDGCSATCQTETLTVAASVSPTSGATTDTYTVTCTVTGGTATTLEARCNSADSWTQITTGNTKSCTFSQAGSYTPGCRVNGTTDDNVDNVVSVSGAIGNNPPVISAVTAGPGGAENQGSLTCTATDPDGDTLTYSWSAPAGTFSTTTAATTIWTEPSVIGFYDITVTVSDGRGGSDSEIVPVTVFSHYNTPGTASTVFVNGNYAFVGDGNNVLVLDVSDTYNPSLIKTLNMSQSTFSMATEGNYLYVQGKHSSSCSNLVYTFDISDPVNTSLIGYFSPWTISSDCAIYSRIAVKNGHLYLNISTDLATYDVSNPLSPVRESGNHVIGDTPKQGLVLSGDYAYASSQNYGIRIFSLTQPSNPISVATYNTGAFNIQAQGNYLYVTNAGSLQVLNISNPISPELVSSLDGVGQSLYNYAPEALYVKDDFLYNAMGTNGVKVVDISNAANPDLLGTHQISAMDAQGVFVSGNVLYVAGGSGGLYLLPIGY